MTFGKKIHWTTIPVKTVQVNSVFNGNKYFSSKSVSH